MVSGASGVADGAFSALPFDEGATVAGAGVATKGALARSPEHPVFASPKITPNATHRQPLKISKRCFFTELSLRATHGEKQKRASRAIAKVSRVT